MLEYYQHYIANWRARTASLTADQYRVFHILIEEAVIEEGPIVPHVKALAGKANMSARRLTRAVQDLVDLGEVTRGENGKLSCAYADERLDHVEEWQANARKAGAASALSRKKRREGSENPNEINACNEESGNRRGQDRTGQNRGQEREEEGTRLPDTWKPTTADVAFGRNEGLSDAEIERSFDQFRDHYKAAPGRKGLSVDWSATLRKWLRNEADIGI